LLFIAQILDDLRAISRVQAINKPWKFVDMFEGIAESRQGGAFELALLRVRAQ
jgi:hypothetical protein